VEADQWTEIELEQVVNYKKGKKPKQLNPVSFPSSVPYINIEAFETGNIQQYADVVSSNICTKNDILVVWDGARFGLAASNQQGAIGSTLMALTPILIETRYLLRFIQSNYSFIQLHPKGTGIPHVNPEIFWNLKVPLPPLAEQQRIVEKLDAILPKIKAVKARLDKIPVILKRFRQSILADACSGRLTEDWRKMQDTDISSSSLFDKISSEKINQYQAQCLLAKTQRKRCPKDHSKNKLSKNFSGDLPEIPLSWDYYRLEDLCHLITDGTHRTPQYVQSGRPFLSVKNVRPFQIKDIDKKYISEIEYKEINSRCNPEKGDILYTKVGATFGYAAINDLDYNFSIFVSLALIKPVHPFFYSKYVEILMNSEVVFSQARERVSGIGVPDLHLIEIRDFRVPLPPLHEQHEIVRRVEKLFTLTDSLEAKYQVAMQRINKIEQTVLAKAFRGELASQDPNDEPAAMLLERIVAKKKLLEKANSGRKQKQMDA